MTSTDWFALGAIVFVIACLWFTSMIRILIGQLDTIAAELRGINAKLGRTEDQGK